MAPQHTGTEVAIVAFAHARHTDATPGTTNGVEMLAPLYAACYEQTGLDRTDIDFWCSGSSDYLAGRAFSFISAIDSIGAAPSIQESHVEADAAWALYEAWMTIRLGHADTALVYGFGKPSASADLDRTMAMQLDPYTVKPLWPGRHQMAALQARAGLESGAWTREAMTAVAERVHGGVDADAAVPVADPLYGFDCPPVTDGAAVVVLASAERAHELCARPAWISGIGQAIDSAEFGARDLARAPSVAAALAQAGGLPDDLAVAELHTPYSHQELIVRRELGLDDLDGAVLVTPSGGSMAGDPMFSAGLERIGYAARAVFDGACAALAHASQGPLLQHNLVTILEGREA